MSDMDEADQEVIDILDSDNDQEQNSNEALIHAKGIVRFKVGKFKKTLDYFLYQKCCSERIATPNLLEMQGTSNEKKRQVRDWSQSISDKVDNCRVKISPEVIENHVALLKINPKYKEFDQVVPKDHFLRSKVHFMEFKHGVLPSVYKQIDEEWHRNLARIKTSGDYKLLKLERKYNIDLSQFPSWLKPPKKSDFRDENDFEIAATFFYILCVSPQNAKVNGEIHCLSYETLVQAFKERKKCNVNLPKKALGALRGMLYYWCPQSQWQTMFDLNCAKYTNKINLKNQNFRIQQFKLSPAYQSCPEEMRPKTPDLESFSVKSRFSKAIDKWIEDISRMLPRSMKPLHLVKDEDMKATFQSDLYKDYQNARCNGLTEKILPNKTVKTLEEWDRVFAEWQEKLRQAVNQLKNKGALDFAQLKEAEVKKLVQNMASFKNSTMWRSCTFRPDPPRNLHDLDIAEARKQVQNWKEMFYKQLPRKGQPLSYVKDEDMKKFRESALFSKYELLRGQKRIPDVPLSRQAVRIEDWDEDFNDWTGRIWQAIQPYEESEESLEELPFNTAQKSAQEMSIEFRFDLINFKNSQVYNLAAEKRPPTPNFYDFQEPKEAMDALDKWMRSIYSSVPRHSRPLFVIKKADIDEFRNSGLFATYIKLRKQNLLSKTSIKQGQLTLQEWDDYWQDFIKDIKESIHAAKNLQSDLPNPAKLSSNEILIEADLPKPTSIKRKTEESSPQASIKKVKLENNEGIDLNLIQALDPQTELLKYVQEKSNFYGDLVDKREGNCRGFIGSLVGACVRYVPCGLYNKDKSCQQPFVHSDEHQEKRIHACALCYYALCGMITMHSLMKCPLLQYS